MESISVIIPVYNASGTILKSVDSVINELVDNDYYWEIILVDDHSTDDSLEMMHKAYGEKSVYSDKIRIVELPINSGAAVARNEGLKLAKGTIIAFNDSDDEWMSGKVKLQMGYLERNLLVEMVSGYFYGDHISVIKKIDSETLITIKNQIYKNYFSPQCVMFRKSALAKTGFFHPKMRYAEEGFFFNKMVFYCRCILLNVAVTRSITNKKRWGDSGLSGNLWGMEKGELFNTYVAYKSGFISFPSYIIATLFSLLKYLRRVLLKYYLKYIKSTILFKNINDKEI